MLPRYDGPKGSQLSALSVDPGRQSQRFPNKSKVAPLPPGADGADAGGDGDAALMSDHLRARGAGRSAQLGRARAARTQGQRGGGAPRRHQPRGGRAHEPHRVLLAPDAGPDSDQRDVSPAEPNRDCTLPDSTNSELLNTNALLLQNFNEALNYKDRHHLPKVFDRAIKNISEAVSARDERTRPESQSHPLYPKLSREENLPGSTADADGLSNLYHHTERVPHRTQKDNDRRNLNITTSEEQTNISFSSILDKHTAIYRLYALPDTTSPINNDENSYSRELSNGPYYPHISQQNYRKESKTESKKSVGLENNPNYSSGQGDKVITQYDAPIIKAPSEFSDEQSPLPPMTMSFSNMMTMPVSNVHLTERQLPTEYVAVPVKKISQVSKQNKQRKKNTPPKIPMKPTQHAVSPVKYIPINLDNPMVNPEFLPKTKGNFPTKKVTPPKRPPSPVEYIPIPINPKTRQPQVFTRVHKGMRHPHPGSNRPRTRTPIEGPVFITQPHESQRYVMHPSAPRLSYSSMDGWRSEGPSSFASIDPRKLRTQRVSPLLFVPMYKPL
ncbi:uncharacterized protein LOC135077829 [Ostrinia nubilalis]|uniref:uncharacterized protein LOC135077829 n=1 Tax=Ostrinia nubilalis TaxID=29057 RepID=UPI0030825DEF